ncbi:hypothetical protein BO71DRAFT_434750 [Aspergillus ellipticus CBS 707.79]|uniref:Uncharacterized protein n=1 Tax=Aspergillus ellipticus CBS 707.79 TaxID=1448320 RepID=A0A319CXQ3_9EURO|nr:hypothetical protein BO71DRAFT_434750 [Aspergillus ellipticus CBS 707.79]
MSRVNLLSPRCCKQNIVKCKSPLPASIPELTEAADTPTEHLNTINPRLDEQKKKRASPLTSDGNVDPVNDGTVNNDVSLIRLSAIGPGPDSAGRLELGLPKERNEHGHAGPLLPESPQISNP